jgi:membrane-bound lytic murein transglycosylase D
MKHNLNVSLFFLGVIFCAGCSAARLMERPERVRPPELRDTRALVRQIAGECSVPIDVNSQVVDRVNALRTVGRKRTIRLLSKSGRYTPMVTATLKTENVPPDLVWMVFVESGFNPLARSRSQAVGLWQFIRATGERFDLRVDEWVDERRDPEKSTRAAARYLRWMYDQFEDWRLVIAGYHHGRLNVQRLIDRQGTRDVWKLNLPGETREYITAVMAAVVVARRPEAFGLQGIIPEPPLDYDEVPVEGDLDLEKAARYATCDVMELRRLNPELLRDRTPPQDDVYRLKVPKGRGNRFAAGYRGNR